MTRTIYLLGHPVAHSVSPAFQQAALDHLAVDARYQAWDVRPDSIGDAVAALRESGCLGANVTVPHKQAVVPHLDDVSIEAQRIGAVNTIVRKGDRLEGHNTDAAGFLRALRDDGEFDPAGQRALVLGAGGSARAVCVALASAGAASISIANRTLQTAQVLTALLADDVERAEAVSLEPAAVARAAPGCDLIVNCTSLGMAGGPDPAASPITADAILPHALVFDLVYNPQETPLLREAAKAGARQLGGLAMLVYQGAASFEMWTTATAPVDAMFRVAQEALAAR